MKLYRNYVHERHELTFALLNDKATIFYYMIQLTKREIKPEDKRYTLLKLVREDTIQTFETRRFHVNATGNVRSRDNLDVRR